MQDQIFFKQLELLEVTCSPSGQHLSSETNPCLQIVSFMKHHMQLSFHITNKIAQKIPELIQVLLHFEWQFNLPGALEYPLAILTEHLAITFEVHP